MACPLKTKSYSSFIVSLDFGFSICEKNGNILPGWKKESLITMIYSSIKISAFRICTNHTLYYGTKQDCRFIHVSSEIFAPSPFFFSLLKLTRYLQKKTVCGQHELWSGRQKIWLLNKTRLELDVYPWANSVPWASILSLICWTTSLLSLTIYGFGVEKANKNMIRGGPE